MRTPLPTPAPAAAPEQETPRRTVAAWSLPVWAAVLASAAAGLLLDLASAPVGWWPLTFVSVTVALVALIGRSIGGALLVGTVFGAVFYTTHLVWVGEFLGPVPWLALAGLEAVLFGAGAVPIALAYRWTARYPARGLVQLLAVPPLIGVLWTAREVVMGAWPYSGFPWARLGMTQVGGPLAEAVSWTSVTGLSLLIVILCASVVQWIRAGGIRFMLGLHPAVSVAALLVIAPQFPTAPAGEFRVGWVQGNGPTGYFDDKVPGDVLAAQTAATVPLYGQPMDLLAWPEGGVDADPLSDPAAAEALDRVVRSAGAPLLMNAATTRGDDVFNTSLLWTADPTGRQWHDKVNPVPFGEYVPDRWFYELIVPDLVGLIQREYTPGSSPPLVQVGDVGVGLAICFDVIYDAVIWDGARAGAEVFVFQTNNADFRGTDENLQQLAFARMRAIETGRAVVNVSTVGTSQVITPDGTTVDSIGVDTVDASITTVPLRTGLTPAVILGPWLTALIVLAAAGALTAAGFSHRARTRAAAADRSTDPGRHP
ncbi:MULTISPECIES: apolipoprotein N-acyltransferase [Microbacterium]|jgi:apolipoprotein N-acyltransferase|uniref:Apolipoprotein N-acyltransferase n=3 Tax=Microbacterium TaxID=33882 RepID=A0A0F0LVK1_9MICO|nr:MULTISPECIES: apolipoprotein N-acyltransferase [Microbacterium]KJL37337.1 Apolipoprotein N-acyltransferase [Microbacterium ginsengisoli]KZE89842.1 Apolipoprotein N-acyltransferase [Microbacterium sp. TNHR37B]MBN9178547.1 apolipoprotein N-acyltransferase [Microbacterium sp.]MBN9209257.1 apolipoprotein N-acyltransferase [Microbacterium ginsengisoli]MBN9216005.1 apolipoprotein N-acyltransferase [Microbacterium sp.]